MTLKSDFKKIRIMCKNTEITGGGFRGEKAIP